MTDAASVLHSMVEVDSALTGAEETHTVNGPLLVGNVVGDCPQTNKVLEQVQTHCVNAFGFMRQMRNRGELCDIKVMVSDVEITAHKLVLAACSPYFHAMFTNGMTEEKQNQVTLHDVDPQAMQQLVDYAYTSEISIEERNVQVLLPAASLLQVESVREACCEYLLRQLDPSNCLGIRMFADTHACPDLLNKSQQYTLQNFVNVMKTEEFLTLPIREVIELMSSDQLNVPSEEDVFTSMMLWINSEPLNRRKYIAQLLSCVRLPLLTRGFLIKNVEAEPSIRCDTECKDLLIEAMKYHLMPEQRALMESSRTRQRSPDGLKSVLFAVGGGSLFAIHGECECYDPSKERWYMMASMSTKRARVGVVVIANNLYAVGGYDGSNDLPTVEKFAISSNTWYNVESMGTRRSCVGVAAVNGLVFAVGGFDGASCLNTAERYDPLTNSWTSIAAMATRRRYTRLGVIDDCIYAVGGYDGSSHLASVEKYDPSNNEWSPVSCMSIRRSSAGVAVIDGFLYVVGGNDGSSCLSAVERFNPRKETWETLSSMNIRRSTHDVVAVGCHLYAVGGNDGSSSLNSMEKYDPKTNTWVNSPSMVTRRSSVGVAAARVTSLPNSILSTEII